ncbi:MAG: hypothetical protein KDA87_22260, partial [Planctomycetales bacterium]|nr:hypothetical protein [Planctomycetales bacterium]
MKKAVFFMVLAFASPLFAQGIFAPGDAVIGGQSDGTNFVAGVSGTAGGVNNWPGAEGPEHLIDGVGQKYLNFAEFNTGV